jgi:hypothetical protein
MTPGTILEHDDPVAIRLVQAIRTGDLDGSAVATVLMLAGADPNAGVEGAWHWIATYAKRTPAEIAVSFDTERESPVSWLRDHGAPAGT